MTQDQSVQIWILTLEPRLVGQREARYFFRRGADYGDLVHALRTAGFRLDHDWAPDDDGVVRVGLLRWSRNGPGDHWSVGHAPHHYSLPNADRQATIDAILGVELQQAIRIIHAVEGASGEAW